MAKRVRLGSICKRKDGTGLYLKVNTQQPVTLTPGQFITIETQKQQRDSLQSRVAEGKVKGDWVQKELERIEKIPEWVMGEASVTVDD